MKLHQEGTQKVPTHQTAEGVMSVGVEVEAGDCYIFPYMLVYDANL